MRVRGRDAAIADACTALAERRNVVLLGAPGSGRTTVLGMVAEAYPHGHRLAGRDRVPGVPLAVMAPVVASAGLSGADLITVYSRLPSLLALGTAEPAVVLVDDVDLLDPGSAVLLAQLVRAGVSVMASSTAEAALPHGLRDALVAGAAATVHLEPLTIDDIALIAADRLGGELSVEALAGLALAAGGLPERVVELLAAGASGARSTPGGIELGAERLTPVLRQRCAAALAPLSAAATATVELVCAADRVPEVALELPALDEAVAAGVLRHDPTSLAATVRPVDDVLAAEVAERLGSTRVRQRREELRDRLVVLAPTSSPCRARLTELELDLRQPTPGDAVVGMETALAEHRGADARRLAAAAPDPPDSAGPPDSADPPGLTHDHGGLTPGSYLLLRGRCHLLGGALELAEADLAAVTALGDVRQVAAAGAELGQLHAVRRADPARAVAVVEELLTRLPPADARGLAADLVKWRLMAGMPLSAGRATPVETTSAGEDSDATVVGRPLDTAGLEAANDRIGVAVISAMVASLDGPVDAAHEIVRGGLDEIARTPVAPPHAADLLRLSSYLATAFDGRLGDAEQFATEHRDTAVLAGHPAVGMWEYAAAELALHTRRWERSRALARRAVHHLAWQDFTGLRPTTLALLGALEARAGRAEAVAVWLAELAPDADSDVKVALHLRRVEACARPAEGAALLADVGRRAIAESQALLGLLAIDEAFGLAGRAERAPLAAELRAHAHRAPLVAALAQRAEAVLDRDARALEGAASALHAMGWAERAAETWRLAAEWHRDRGAQEAARRVDRHHDAIDRGSADVDVLADLSAREREVAVLAATLRNREVADRLGLSVRTVENHLARAFRKLGVTRREELAAVLGRDLPA